MYWSAYSLMTGIGTLVGMLLLFQLGRLLGLRQKADGETKSRVGAMDGAVLALLGLLIAFSFSGAAARFDSRRQLIVQEANNIGTAWLRIDLLPPAIQTEMRDLFRRYLDARLDVYAKLPDFNAARSSLRRCAELQKLIWDEAVKAGTEPPSQQVIIVFLPALNQMIDVTTTRTAMTLMHPPSVIFVMLVVVALASALLAGHALGVPQSPSWLHVIGFAAAISFTIAVIVDLEYPRLGLIREGAIDQVLIDLRSSMEPQPAQQSAGD
jgi:hypothetical protein